MTVEDASPWPYARASLLIPSAASLSAAALRGAVRDAYLRLHDTLGAHATWRPVRFWNYIPHIHARTDSGLTRYMEFNAGRYEAMELIHGSKAACEARVATATGVGHDGEDLLISCLATREGGEPVENPRQIPAYRYSTRHGPVPPCFARATLLRAGGRAVLMIGGTAAVCGEDSTNAGDLAGQLAETFTNLEHLLSAARSRMAANDARASVTVPARSRPSFNRLRAYVVRPDDAPLVEDGLLRRVPGLDAPEIVRADVCRPELLVEIEGWAEL